jgi:hypothetical protein
VDCKCPERPSWIALHSLINLKEYFRKLQHDGFYESDMIADRVVFLFVFVPILRHELYRYVETHNDHRIRPQLARANHVPGRPNELYDNTTIYRRWGFSPDEDLLSDLEGAVSYVGKLPVTG